NFPHLTPYLATLKQNASRETLEHTCRATNPPCLRDDSSEKPAFLQDRRPEFVALALYPSEIPRGCPALRLQSRHMTKHTGRAGIWRCRVSRRSSEAGNSGCWRCPCCWLRRAAGGGGPRAFSSTNLSMSISEKSIRIHSPNEKRYSKIGFPPRYS